MAESKKATFMQWYNTVRLQVFDFQKVGVNCVEVGIYCMVYHQTIIERSANIPLNVGLQLWRCAVLASTKQIF